MLQKSHLFLSVSLQVLSFHFWFSSPIEKSLAFGIHCPLFLTMKGKAVEFVQDYSFPSDVPCKKHPRSCSVGICAYCLEDRLVKLVCSDCGEQRLSSCSCSEISNARTSCAGEVGSVGRVSFLLENENKDQSFPNPKHKGNSGDKSENVLFLKRSSSSCVEIKRKNGFWRFGRLFRKKRDKGVTNEKNDLWVVDYNGVSRSRSLCSFRNGGFFGSEDGGDSMSFSGARSSSISAARSSSVCVDPERKSGFSEAEPRKSGFDSDRRDSTFMESDVAADGFGAANRRVFSLRESYFTGGDNSGFIDLKFEFPSESKGDDGGSNSIQNDLVGDNGAFYGGASCRVTVNERGIKRSRKSFKGWRWIFKQNQDWSSTRKKNGELMINH